MGNDPYNGLSWMTEEMKDELRKRDEIVANEDISSLFNLNDNSDFSIALHEILLNISDKDSNSLNSEEINLFWSMYIEHAARADSILSFSQEWFPQFKDRVIEALT